MDEDWKKFMDATQQDAEEVETDPTEDTEDETKNPQDDPANTPANPNEDEEENPANPAEDSEEEGNPEESKPSASDYKPRLGQFVKSDGTYDIEKAEKAYIESSKQGVKLNKDLENTQDGYNQLLGAIKAKPEVAKALFGEEGAKQLLADGRIPTGGNPGASGNGADGLSDHPLIKHLEAQMNAQSRKEYNEFVEAHPEAVTDPEKASKIGEFLKFYGTFYKSQNDGQLPTMKEALEAAYRQYGWTEEIKNKEDVATAAKRAAATQRTPGAKRAPTKKEVTQSEQFFAKKLGVKL